MPFLDNTLPEYRRIRQLPVAPRTVKLLAAPDLPLLILVGTCFMPRLASNKNDKLTLGIVGVGATQFEADYTPRGLAYCDGMTRQLKRPTRSRVLHSTRECIRVAVPLLRQHFPRRVTSAAERRSRARRFVGWSRVLGTQEVGSLLRALTPRCGWFVAVTDTTTTPFKRRQRGGVTATLGNGRWHCDRWPFGTGSGLLPRTRVRTVT